MKKNIKGITLVALVITIVVLLILAGISIQAITNTGFRDCPTVWDMESDKVRPIVQETKRVFELYATTPMSFSYAVPF